MGFDPTRAISKPLGNICTVIHTNADPVSSAEVNSHFGLLGLGVAPRFLQKVRARPEILSNKIGLLLHHEAAPGERRACALLLVRRSKSPKLFVKISGRALTFCKNLGATPNPNQPKCGFLVVKVAFGTFPNP